MSSSAQNGAQPHWNPLGTLEFTRRGCPVCNTDAGTLLHNKKTSGYEMHFCLCPTCNCLYAANPVTEDSLQALYGSKDFFAAGKPGEDNIDYFDFIGGEKFLRKTARGRIERIKRFKSGGKLLEVASAAGFFLIEAKEAGFDTRGVEISVPMANYASARWGVPVTGASIERIDLPAEHFDVIASWGVMTILRDPVGVVRKFQRALKPGGVWAFNTYYHDCVWHQLVGARWNILGVQTSQIYSKRLLLELVEREGFRLLSRRRDWPHSDLLKIADQLAMNTGWKWLVDAVAKAGLKNCIVRIPLPDVYEYIWQKIDG
jgi:SAM-dependent methyltransferase